jgi:hypothetical protein
MGGCGAVGIRAERRVSGVIAVHGIFVGVLVGLFQPRVMVVIRVIALGVWKLVEHLLPGGGTCETCAFFFTGNMRIQATAEVADSGAELAYGIGVEAAFLFKQGPGDSLFVLNDLAGFIEHCLGVGT